MIRGGICSLLLYALLMAYVLWGCRIGRTARAGRSGAALTFISEEELPYVELLRGRGVPMAELSVSQLTEEVLDGRSAGVAAVDRESNGDGSDNELEGEGDGDEDGDSANQDSEHDEDENESEEAGDVEEGIAPTPSTSTPDTPTILTAIRDICKTDRELLEAGTTAFISFLRAYKEHLCSFIFRLDQLDIGAVARSYALIKLPRIAETVKHRERISFEECTDVNTSTIPYRHKAKEEARVKRQEERLAAARAAEEGEVTAQDEEKAKIMQARQEARDKKAKQQELLQKQQAEEQERKRKRKKKEGLHKQIMNEWEELAAEETLYKKFKKGKITKEKYEDALTGDDVLAIDDVVALGNRKKRGYSMDSDPDMSSDGDDSDDDDSDGNHSKGAGKAAASSSTSKKKSSSSGRPGSMLLTAQGQGQQVHSASHASKGTAGSSSFKNSKKKRSGVEGTGRFAVGKGVRRSSSNPNVSFRSKIAKLSRQRRR